MILRTTLTAAILMQLSLFVSANFRLQLLHNNDMHARFEETEEDTDNWSCESDKCFGGFARVKQAADQFIKDAASRNISTIFLNAGDTFQGTPYYTLQKWRIVAPLFEAIGFDVTCLGNHEFDDGIDNLVEYMNHIRTPIVTCNLNITTEERLRVPNLRPSTILHIGNKRIGVIGYLTTTTTESSRTENLQILDEIKCLREEARRMKSIGINIIIGLGHSGIERDKEIAEEVEELSLIVGGHSHTMMYTPKEDCLSIETAQENYPLFVIQKSGKRVPIVQAYKHTKYLGRLFVEFDDNGDVVAAEGNPVILDSSVPKDPRVNNLVELWTNSSKALLKAVKGYLRVPLLRSNTSALEFESNVGNLITDAFLYQGVKFAKKSNLSLWTSAPIAIFNRGGIRTDLSQGDIRLGDLYTMVPYDDDLYKIELPGSKILEALESVVASDGEHYSVLDLAGLRVVYDLNQPIGSRVLSVFVLCKKCPLPHYEELEPDKMYSVLITDFLRQGKSNFEMFQNDRTPIALNGTTATAAVIEYIERLEYIYPELEGRIRVLQRKAHDSNSTYSFFGITVVIVTGVMVVIFLSLLYYCRYTRKTQNTFSYQYHRLDS